MCDLKTNHTKVFLLYCLTSIVDAFEASLSKLKVRVVCFVLVTQIRRWHNMYKLLKRLFNEYVNSR